MRRYSFILLCMAVLAVSASHPLLPWVLAKKAEWKPTDIEDCAVWLRGDQSTMDIDEDDVVTSWKDQSGNDRHFTPSVNGHAASGGWGMSFDKDRASVDTAYSSGYVPSNSRTVFVTYKSGTPYRTGNRIWGHTLGGYVDAQAFAVTVGDFVVRVRYRNLIHLVVGESLTTVNLITDRYDATAQTYSVWIDGASAGVGTGQAAATPYGEMFIGAGGTTLSFTGDMFSFIVYDRALTDEEILLVEEYLTEQDGDYF